MNASADPAGAVAPGTAAERLRNAATSVRNSRWPNKPAIGSGGW